MPKPGKDQEISAVMCGGSQASGLKTAISASWRLLYVERPVPYETFCMPFDCLELIQVSFHVPSTWRILLTRAFERRPLL